MSDLLALQPNLALQLYLVAPEERAAKVQQETTRPMFVYRERPLREVCAFISFEKLMPQVEAVSTARSEFVPEAWRLLARLLSTWIYKTNDCAKAKLIC